MILRKCGRICAVQLRPTGRLAGARRFHGIAPSVLRVSEEVQEALATNKPVVSLETTIYTHGFPHPKNIELSESLESIVRREGGVPATIGILDGKAIVGLTSDELRRLVETPGARKVSRRDLPMVLSTAYYGNPLHGGTTIAGTIILSSLAGIRVFATGGLGGVHRGAETSMDISADLTELGRTRDIPVAVISSGCKGFLDIPRTLEYLETQGATVATFRDGRQGPIDFPAFWSRESGSRSPDVIENEIHAAAIIHAQTQARIGSGMILANPVPSEYQIPHLEMKAVIDKAVTMADAAGAHGSANTPFVLNAIKDLFGDRAIAANKALIENNAVRATKVARELCKLAASGQTKFSGSPQSFPAAQIPSAAERAVSETLDLSSSPTTAASTIDAKPSPVPAEAPASIIVAGSLALDTSCDYAPSAEQRNPVMHSSNPSSISQTVGGVAHNVALAAHYCGAAVRLCSIVRDDIAGQTLLTQLPKSGLSPASIYRTPAASTPGTAQYISFNNSGKDLVVAMADMSIVETPHAAADKLWSQTLKNVADHCSGAAKTPWLVLDGNWTSQRLHRWIKESRQLGYKVAFEPVSTAKSTRLLTPDMPSTPPNDRQALLKTPSVVDLATPNSHELSSMHAAASSKGLFEREDWWHAIDAMGIPFSGARSEMTALASAALVDAGIPQMAVQLLPFVTCLLVKLGGQGVLMVELLSQADERLASGADARYILSRSAQARDVDGRRAIGGVYMRLFPVPEQLHASEIVSVNGAGDTFLGALLAGLDARKSRVDEWVDSAQHASGLTLRSPSAVSEKMRGMKGFR